MKKALYLWLAVLAVCGLTTTAFADAIAEPAVVATSRVWLPLVIVVLLVTVFIAKRGGKGK